MALNPRLSTQFFSLPRQNRECLAPLKYRACKPFRQVRLTKVDPENKALRPIVQELQECFTSLLHNAAMSACGLTSIPAERPIPSLVLQCAHDPIMDPSTKKKMAPHFIVDCTYMSKMISDIAAKSKFGDKEQELYEVLASEAGKKAKNTAKKKCTAEKNVPKAEKKWKAADQKLKQAGASGGKAMAKAQKAAAAAAKKLAKTRKALELAKQAAAQAETYAKTIAQKAKKAIEIQADIIQCWSAVVSSLPTAGPNLSGVTATVPEYLESWLLWLAPCLKCEDRRECS